MVGRIYLHIGAMKSATSYLQDLFDVNAEQVAAQGMLWPSTQTCFLATGDLLDSKRDRPGLAGAWDELADRLHAHSGTALLSNELLSMAAAAKRERLVQALAPADVRLIITVRDLGRVVPSQWQTGMRNRKTTPWREYVEAICSKEKTAVGSWFWRRQDIPALVRRWRRVVPVDHMTVVTVPPTGSDPALIGQRFAAAVGLDSSSFREPAYTNPSLGTVSAELMRRVNERSGDMEWLHYMWAFKNGLARLVLADRAAKEPPIALDEQTHRVMARRARRMIKALQQIGVHVVGDLSDLLPAPPSDVAVDPGAASVPQLLDAAIDALVGLGVTLADVRVEHDFLIQEVERFLGRPRDGGRPDWDDETAGEGFGGEFSPNGRLATSRYLRMRLGERALAPEPV